MGKLATRPKAEPKAAIRSNKGRKADTVTFNMGAGFSREPKSELFLLAVTNMVSEDTFYEKAADRDRRFEKLVCQVALEDPDRVARFVPYLRDTMNMRSASIVMAAIVGWWRPPRQSRPQAGGTERRPTTTACNLHGESP